MARYKRLKLHDIDRIPRNPECKSDWALLIRSYFYNNHFHKHGVRDHSNRILWVNVISFGKAVDPDFLHQNKIISETNEAYRTNVKLVQDD